MPKSLKLRRLERRVILENQRLIAEKGLTYEGKILVEAINKELLKRYSSAVNTAERLNTLLGTARMEDLREITIALSKELQKELQKATNFRGRQAGIPGTNKVMNYLRSWLGEYYKGGALKKLANFVEEFKQGITRTKDFIDSSLPEKIDRAGENQTVADIVAGVSTTLEIDELREMIINAFEFRKSEWNDALDDTAEAILNIPYNMLGDLVSEVQKIDSNIDSTVDVVDQAAEEAGVSKETEEPVQEPASPAPSKPEALAKALANLDPNVVDRIVRSANRQRRKLG